MNKKRKIAIIVFSVALIIVGLIFLAIGIKGKKSNEKYGYWVTDSDYLYDKAIDYLEKDLYNSMPFRDEENFHVFLDYDPLGIKEKDNKKYVYMYVGKKSYYVKKEKLRSGEAGFSAYKFTFENDEPIKYEVPLDGGEMEQSTREMFPDDIEDKIIGYEFDSTNLEKQKEEYYSYLESTSVVGIDKDEEPILVYGTYGGYSTKKEANTIKGKFIDGYGDIYEYTIPCNVNEELMVNIDDIEKNIIIKYKENNIGNISKEDLNELKNNLKNVNEEYANIEQEAEDLPSYFIKVAYTPKNDLTLQDYSRKDLTDLINYKDTVEKKNISEEGKQILEILNKYKFIE